MKQDYLLEPQSFRDPDAFVFYSDGKIYRQINESYSVDYSLMIENGLYTKLIEMKQLIPHKEVELSELHPPDPGKAWKIIQPQMIPMISYPWEWCFSQLKDAALLTLQILQAALRSGMTLKDGNGYNIQFNGCRPVFIDSTSFTRYIDGSAWVGYGQFCRHFLAPLLLAAYSDEGCIQLLRSYTDGIPLELACNLLPFSCKLNPMVAMHIVLHAKAEKKQQGNKKVPEKIYLPKDRLLLLFESMSDWIKSLSLRKNKTKSTEWLDYTQTHSYSKTAWDNKIGAVRSILEESQCKTVWDLGSNTGYFSRLATQKGIFTVSMDLDHSSVDKNYLDGKKVPAKLSISDPCTPINISCK